MTPQEFIDKADYEGGLTEAILGYGLSENDLDDSDPELKEAVTIFRQTAGPLLDRLERIADRYAPA